MTKLKQCDTQAQVFAVLDDFRKQEWTDEQCAQIAKLYIRLLDNLEPGGSVEEARQDKKPVAAKDGSSGTAVAAAVKPAFESAPEDAGDGESELDGPVWYEKM